MKRFVICLAVTFGIIFGGALWFHVMKLMFGPENAFVYAMMELAAVLVAIIVWAFWNLVSPEKEEEEKDQTVRIELIGQDLFKYEGDRIEKVGAMWEAKDWMEPLMKKTDWDQCMAAIDDRNRIKTIRKLARQEEEKQRRAAGVKSVKYMCDSKTNGAWVEVEFESGERETSWVSEETIAMAGGWRLWQEDLERRARFLEPCRQKK